jgi:hypothetical protein
VITVSRVVATADRNDRNHHERRLLLESEDGPLITTTTMVITEAAYLIDRQVSVFGELALYSSILDGSIDVDRLMMSVPEHSGAGPG